MSIERIEGPWKRNRAATFVHDGLAEGGFRVLFVGSAVRNTLLGLPSGDFDISTDATPEAVLGVFRASGAKLRTQGLRFGTVTVIHQRTPVEVTSFRKDIETDGRHARVEYTNRIGEDAARRDFTMNAIYSEYDGTLLDPLGVIDDLLSRRVRFVGRAPDRIREDGLRMLRYFRFHAHFGDQAPGMDPEALAAVAEHSDRILAISPERITHEILKLLAADSPSQAAGGMARAGLLERILPGASPRHCPRLEALEGQYRCEPDPLRRLTAMGGDTGRLRLDRRSARRLQLLSSGTEFDGSLEELGYRFGVRDSLDIVLLRAVRTGENLPDNLLERIETGSALQFPVKVSDLPRGLKGAEIGKALRTLERLWLDSGFSMTKRRLLSCLGDGSGEREAGGT